MWKTFVNLVFQQSLLLTSLLLIQKLKLQPLKNFVQKSMFLLNWLAFGLMVLMVVLTLPTRLLMLLKMRMLTINVFILMMIAWKRKSLRLLLKSMVVNQLSSRKKLRTSSNNLQNLVGTNCQYVWLKHNTASLIINSYSGLQKASISRFVSSFLRLVPALS